MFDRIQQPLISVVIPVYNGEPFLSAALDSVLAQTWRHFEIVVIDDGSTDATAAILKDCADRAGTLPDGQPRLRWQSQSNAGQASATNDAIRLSRGELIALIDADDLWLPERLERTADALLADPECGMAYCLSICRDETGCEWPLRGEGFIFDDPASIYRPADICPSASIFRRSALDQVGYFDPAILPGNDTDLFIRMAERFKVCVVHQPLVIYAIRSDSQQHRQPVDFMAQSHLRLVFKALGRRREPQNHEGALAVAYAFAGQLHDRHGNRRLARRYLLISWALRPDRASLRRLLTAWIPTPIARWIRNRRAKLRTKQNNGS